jgi:hypothetical protein
LQIVAVDNHRIELFGKQDFAGGPRLTTDLDVNRQFFQCRLQNPHDILILAQE